MTIMKITSSVDRTKIKVEIRNVSVKRYSYDDGDIVDELYKRFEYESPIKLIIDGEGYYITEFINMLSKNNISIDANGIVKYPSIVENNSNLVNSIEHSIHQDLNSYTLIVNSGHDQYKMYEILLSNGYIISSKVEKDKVHISIHGKN